MGAREMKPSSVPWLEAIPDSWREAPLKVAASCNDEALGELTDPDREIEYIDISSVNLLDGVERTERMKFGLAPSRARRVVRKDDILVSTVRTYLRAIAKIENDQEDLIASTGFAVLRARPGLDPDFLRYLASGSHFVEAVIARSVGVSYPAITATDLVNIKVALPPVDEQRRIAAYLNTQTARIDKLVVRQKRMLALLQEKRDAVVFRYATKGLNVGAKMKDSGVPWLGLVPDHWTVCMLKRAFASAEYGISDALEPAGAVAVLRMGNIVDGRIDMEDLKYIEAVDSALLLRKDDLLFNRTNSLDLVGKVGLFEGCEDPVSFASYLVRLRLTDAHDSRFFAHMLNMPSLLGDVRSRAFVAIGQSNLNPTRYGELRVALPPKQEQVEIAQRLAKELAVIDRLSARASKAVALLAERRSSLITAAVSGRHLPQ